jgi:hypothetical protein
MKNDLTDMMKYINQLESYIYKMESIDDETDDVDEASNETDVDTDETDVDVDETEVQSKDIDFIEIGNNVFLNKKNDQVYEIADDDDLNEDLF